MHTYVFITVISGPDDVTVCKGESAKFTCVLDKRGSGNEIYWYRVTKDRNTTERVDRLGRNFTITTSTINNTLTKNLTITNAIKSYTGYYWVGTSMFSVCNVSLTVTTSM